ncbi:MAG: DUF4422 domain-containing protein [Ruminococcus sp.]|nr:DUF4422 domain-containing protein [Ruminococcus sp.]
MSIYIVTHKKYSMPSLNGYLPIQVGAALHDDLGYLKDSEGDEISRKNPNYCELTALYYIWKNCTDSIVGMVHYRRYFCTKRTVHPQQFILSYDEAAKLLQEYDIIMPYKMYRKGLTIKEDYEKNHKASDYDTCRKVIQEKYPDYLQAFDETSNQKTLFQYNMFICKKPLFDAYCQWLFDILFEVERRVDISEYDAYNQRIFGFLSERLFNVWLRHEKLRVKKLEVYNIEDSHAQLLKANLKNLIKPIIGVDR